MVHNASKRFLRMRNMDQTEEVLVFSAKTKWIRAEESEENKFRKASAYLLNELDLLKKRSLIYTLIRIIFFNKNNEYF